MNKIKTILKSYPLMVFAVVIAVVAVIVLVALVIPGGGKLKEEMAGRSTAISKLKTLQETSVQIPPARPDDLPESIIMVVNQPAIDKLKEIFAKMEQEYNEIFAYAENLNENGVNGSNPHVPMLDGLFPEPADIGKPFDAKGAYRDALVAMLGEYEPGAAYPRLDAAPPVDPEVLAAALDAEQQSYLAALFIDPAQQDVKNLTPEEFDILQRKKLEKMFGLYKAHARQHHIYAVTDIRTKEFPLEVGAWSEPGKQPTMEELWDGQMSLWIIQDILRAIAITNDSHEPTANILDAPVKRLLSVSVVPGYVGINSQGGFQSTTSSRQPLVYDASRYQPNTVRDDEAARLATGAPTETAQPDAVNTFSADKPLPNDFKIAPTGRQSNDLYDVRHANLSVVIQSRRIPELMNNLAAVNFMTVLNATVTNVDEYDPLKDGYVYGPQDAVQLDLLIETIWLRNWTKQFMPRDVRYALGVEKPPAAQPATTPTQ